jgi:hypothetical protein
LEQSVRQYCVANSVGTSARTSLATRAAADIAATQRGCVQPMQPARKRAVAASAPYRISHIGLQYARDAGFSAAQSIGAFVGTILVVVCCSSFFFLWICLVLGETRRTCFTKASFKQILWQLRRLAGARFGHDNQYLVVEHRLHELVFVSVGGQRFALLPDLLALAQLGGCHRFALLLFLVLTA